MEISNFFEDFQKFDAQEVIERLYLGSMQASTDYDELTKRNISHIITVGRYGCVGVSHCLGSYKYTLQIKLHVHNFNS